MFTVTSEGHIASIYRVETYCMYMGRGKLGLGIRGSKKRRRETGLWTRLAKNIL
jgi:hypothetical protein